MSAPAIFRASHVDPWQQRIPTMRQKAKSASEVGRTLAFGLLFRLAAWNKEEQMASAPKHRSYKALIWRLGLACVLLFALVGITDKWQQSAGNSLIAHVVATITWDLYVFAQLGFVAVLVLAMHRYFSNPRGPSGPSNSARK